MPALLQEYLGATPNGIAVIDDQNLQSGTGNAHCLCSSCCRHRRLAPVCDCPGWYPDIRSEPFQSLPCAHRIRGRSSSWALGPMASREQCHVRARRQLRRISSHKLNTSTSLIESQLKLPSNRMQQLYRGGVAYSRTRQNRSLWQTPKTLHWTADSSKSRTPTHHRPAS